MPVNPDEKKDQMHSIYPYKIQFTQIFFPRLTVTHWNDRHILVFQQSGNLFFLSDNILKTLKFVD